MRSLTPAFVIAGLVAIGGNNADVSRFVAQVTGQKQEEKKQKEKKQKEPPKSREQLAKDVAISVGVCLVSAAREQSESRLVGCVTPLLGLIPQPRRYPSF